MSLILIGTLALVLSGIAVTIVAAEARNAWRKEVDKTS